MFYKKNVSNSICIYLIRHNSCFVRLNKQINSLTLSCLTVNIYLLQNTTKDMIKRTYLLKTDAKVPENNLFCPILSLGKFKNFYFDQYYPSDCLKTFILSNPPPRNARIFLFYPILRLGMLENFYFEHSIVSERLKTFILTNLWSRNV